MVKPILQLYPVIPATRQERIEQRPIGRDSDRYQELLAGWHDLVRAADQMGFWGVSTIEHHFHSEGYEVGPAPALMDAYWAAITENVRIGQLGFTMGVQNPIRVAEETAVLDHLTKGRNFVGFSRGYQARWTNILGQHLGSRATMSPAGLSADKQAEFTEEQLRSLQDDDRINRDIFEEQVDIVLRAWKEESIENKGRWEIPYPYEDGVDWGMTATKEMGAPGEMDDDNKIRRVSVVPKPYTDPHPQVFVSSNASKETVEYCGPRGFIPTYFSKIERAAEYGRAYVDAAKTGGHDFAFGQNQALVRWGQYGETEEKARQAVERYDTDIFRDLYAGTTPMTFDENAPVDSVLNSGLWVVGTAAQQRDGYVNLWKQLPAEYVVLIYHYAQQPTESVLENMQVFMESVKPALDELTDYEN